MRFVLCLAAGIVAATAVDAQDAASRKSWYSKWFGGNKSTKKESVKEHVEEPPTPDPAKVRAEAEAAYHRRVAVCYKLQGIALASGDDDLNRKTEQLLRRNWETYLKRTAHLPTATTFRSDEQEIERNLGIERGRVAFPTRTENGRVTAALPAGLEDSGRDVRKRD